MDLAQVYGLHPKHGTHIGFIGTGHMGSALARCLLKAGFGLTVFDINPDVVQPLIELGAVAAASPRVVADKAQIIFACLPGCDISRQVALGANGVVHGQAVKVYIETSTIGEPTMQEIADGLLPKNIGVLDAPVSGGPRGALAGTLSIITAGARQTFETVRPILEAIAANVFYMGAKPGLAQVCKLVNNAISAIGMAAACEAVVTGVKAGLNAAQLIEVINVSTGRNSATADKFPVAILPRTFEYGGPLETAVKDMRLYLEMAERLGVPTWTAVNAAALWQFAASQGGAQQDYTTLIKYIEKWAGVEVRG
jgi:3-hydroxyisobutyrate dehydrogenase-like beta-hydroxyacid dehydrogenase